MIGLGPGTIDAVRHNPQNPEVFLYHAGKTCREYFSDHVHHV